MSARVHAHALTPCLFHGQGAEEHARRFARGQGEVLSEGILTASTARDLVLRAQEGSLVGSMVWIAGPVDEASPAAVDVLLKLLEEGSDLVGVLWGIDEMDIAPTLRSRCHSWWCGGRGVGEAWVSVPSLEDLKADPRLHLEQRAMALWTQRPFDVGSWEQVRNGLCRRSPSLWDLAPVVQGAWPR